MSTTTKRALEAALKKLLSHTTLDKITVQDIAAEAGVNRQTFYYHFHDVYGLIEWILEDELNKVLAGDDGCETWQHGVMVVFGYLKDNRVLIQNTYHSIGRDTLEQYIQMVIRPILQPILERGMIGCDITDEDKEFTLTVYTISMTALLLEWVRTGMKVNPEELVERLNRLFGGSMKHLYAEYRKPAANVSDTPT